MKTLSRASRLKKLLKRCYKVYMRIMITGADGLLGQELVRFFNKSKTHTAIPLTHADIELTDSKNVTDAVLRSRPDAVINCAVVLNVDFCEENPEQCYAVNRNGVSNLLSAAQVLRRPITFVQASSSEVFGRVAEGEYLINGYREGDETRPASVYQKSKKQAEDTLIDFSRKYPDALSRWYVARTGWLYGSGRPTFVEQFLEKLQKNEIVQVIRDQWRSPTWTKHFAHGLLNLLSKNDSSGIYHIVNEVKPGEATTLDVIQEIQKFLGPRNANPPLKFISRNELFEVPRAPSNVLLNTKLPRLPYWRNALQEYLSKKSDWNMT